MKWEWRQSCNEALLAMLSIGATFSFPATASPLIESEADALGRLDALLVDSPYRIPASALSREIRYVIDTPKAAAWHWPSTGEQRVSMTDDKVVIHVCAGCGNESAPNTQYLEAMRSSNRWVDSDDRNVRAFARSHGGSGNVERRMKSLVIAVQRHMNGPVQYAGYHAASKALHDRAGDCTEFAVLLAAAARANGIPARLAFGIAYSSRFVGRPNKFGPHVWTQIWNGTSWRSFDAGLGQFDAGHIALLVGNGDPHAMPGISDLPLLIASMSIVEAGVVERQ